MSTPTTPTPTSHSSRLAALGIHLPTPPKPVAAYVPGRRVGNLLYISGQLPSVDGKLTAIGPVPSAVSADAAKAAARQCAINAIAVAAAEVGGIDNIVGVIRVGAWVASDAAFTGQPGVANGASELLAEVFGEAGKHARAAVGTNVLPLGATVEVEVLFEVR